MFIPMLQLQGSYYGAMMEKAEGDKRIGDVPYDPTIGVETWWDLGIGDSALQYGLHKELITKLDS